ncbi:DUF4760 domain-containing protein [Sphingomonas sp. Leaf357]|uniref:DUF4760 domain-containing protein n=1 Tax=Sphingomonas sp. Leaf357 TaxID=1736350 RepID=UPI0012E2F2AA|nr:hypothetical protein [Sphingomonas sp. Leaf357]
MSLENYIALGGVLLAFGIAIQQGTATRRSNRVSNTLDLLARYLEPEARAARFNVRSHLKLAADEGGNFQILSEAQRAQFASIASLFGLASLLDDKGEIDFQIILASFGDSIVTNFDRLRDYKKWRDSRHPGDNSLWLHFEQAARKAREAGYTSATEVLKVQ